MSVRPSHNHRAAHDQVADIGVRGSNDIEAAAAACVRIVMHRQRRPAGATTPLGQSRGLGASAPPMRRMIHRRYETRHGR